MNFQSYSTNVLSTKSKPKSLSFQEFDSTMDDAWADSEDDILKNTEIKEQADKSTEGRVRTISGSEVRAGLIADTEKQKRIPHENEMKKEESKVSRPSPLSILSKFLVLFSDQNGSLLNIYYIPYKTKDPLSEICVL